MATQSPNQQFQEPWLAVVIDPTRTVSAGKVEIGAFRTYPQGYKPPDEGASEFLGYIMYPDLMRVYHEEITRFERQE